MDIILLEKVTNLGNLGDKVSVKPGFARNYLFPGGHATRATVANIAQFEARRADLETEANKTLLEAKERLAALEDLSVVIPCKTGDEGKLYGSIGAGDIAEAIARSGVSVMKREIRLPTTGVIRRTGEYEIDLILHADVKTTVKIAVVPDR